MDRVNCTIEELVKTLTNSVPVKLFPPLGGSPITIRVYKLSSGEYVSVFERPPTEPALPPLAQPLTSPALATQNPPTTPPAASPTGFWPLAQTAGAASSALAPAVHPNTRAAT